MLKTLDVLIGVATVLLLFSMGVTLITQGIVLLSQRRGKHLLSGLADLLQQLGIPERVIAEKVASSLLSHPLIAEAEGKLGTVIHREEFIKLLLDLASGTGAAVIEDDARQALANMLNKQGISSPEVTLKNIWAMALQMEAENPEMSNHLRTGLAILREGSSDFVARVNSWFDQTIDRVNHRFARSAQYITLGVAVAITLTVQLDVISIMDRLSSDETARSAFVTEAAKQYALDASAGSTATSSSGHAQADLAVYSLLNSTGLLTMPTADGWLRQFGYIRKWPGMILSALLLSLGAPFWYNTLKDLIGLRSQLARNDEAQRRQRQSERSPRAIADSSSLSALWSASEQGDLTAVG